ncbi:MAG: hypothetical protein FWF15_06080 [Oscillospiraceae bacterium]|nr:hypothetical protein [Oscillospiraceae bacterium]
MKKFTALVLACIMVSFIFTACSENKGSADQTQKTETAAAPEDEIDPRLLISDDLPVDDFGGYDFRILSHLPARYYIEEETGDIINDIVFARNRKIEERFNVNILCDAVPGIVEITTKARTAILANEDVHDLLVPHTITSIPTFITEKLLIDWNEVPRINFDKPWWNEAIIESTRIFGKQFLTASSLNNGMASAFAMLFNKNYIADYNFEDLYKVVTENRWTIDYMDNIIKQVPRDLNGDGIFNEDDQFGLVLNNDNTTLNFMYGFNHESVILGSDGYPIININNELVHNMIQKVYSLIYDDNKSFIGYYDVYNEKGTPMFRDGRAFIICGGTTSLIGFRDVEFEFGIIPYPKWNEQQDGYYTHMDASNGALCVPKTATNLTLIGTIVEALSAESYKMIIPVFYDQALGIKYARDEVTRSMLDIIYAGVMYDFGYIFDDWKGATWTFPFMIVAKTTDLASYYASKEKAILANYEKIFDAILSE